MATLETNPLHQRARFITLGCRVNQYETQGMREALAGAGYASVGRPEDSDADNAVEVVVINTCTVTADADKESRYWVRRAKREHPGARIVVTGCGVQRDRHVYESMPEVDLILHHHEKARIGEHLSAGCARPERQLTVGRQEYVPLEISASEGRTRAFVKIQDGCNHACSFCKVVLVRGRSRSRTLQSILDEVKRLRDAGYCDVSFAGIQLGAYGLDFTGPPVVRLTDVLEACSRIDGIERIRLSSIEPLDVDDALIAALRDISKCAHHLHIPLQSGDDAVLARMNRRYTSGYYAELAAKLRGAMPDFTLTADVMVGFPGESDTAFQNTLDLLETLVPLKCHVFPYSRREGTRAASYEDEVAESVCAVRLKQLLKKSDAWGIRAMRSYIGQMVSLLAERSENHNAGEEYGCYGLMSNFIKVRFDGSPVRAGETISVRLTGVSGREMVGEKVLNFSGAPV